LGTLSLSPQYEQGRFVTSFFSRQEINAWKEKSRVPWHSPWVLEDVVKDWMEKQHDGLDDITPMPATLQESFQV
jgi:hypothetical protein